MVCLSCPHVFCHVFMESCVQPMLLLGRVSGTSRISIDMSSSLVMFLPAVSRSTRSSSMRMNMSTEQVFPDPRLLIAALVPLHGQPPDAQVVDLPHDDPVEVEHVEPQIVWPHNAGLADGSTAILSLSCSISQTSTPLVFLLLMLPHFCINL